MHSLKDYHPGVSLLYFFCVLTCSMMTRNPIWVLLCLIFAIIFVIQLKGFKHFLLQLFYFLPMLIFIVFMNSYFNSLGLTVLFYLGRGSPVTAENLTYGVISGLALLTILLWFTCFNSLISADQILIIMGKSFPTIGLSLAMIIKFIPDTIKQGREVLLNQKAMLGKQELTGNQKVKFAARMITVLLSWSMENSLETADSMLAKGYPSKNRINYSREHLNSSDLGLLITMLILFIIHLISAFSGSIKFTYYPFLKWSGFATNKNMLIISLVSLSLILAFPLVLDIINRYKWQKILKQEQNMQQQIIDGIIVYE
ncbi:MAG TPA: energy-coupling factor transporter transmembrane protein EcfT [Clostridiaceae bacterium]|nr:energy-coupling factor transporter transmembrane protein EcfT [Clostridiaceae bacterium]